MKNVTPLIKATQNGDVSRIERLLKRGVDVSESTQNNITALWLAAAVPRPSIVELLLEAGAETEVVGPAGMTPLLAAVQAGSVQITSMLLEHGAETEARDLTGATPLIVAAIVGHPRILEILIQSEAEIEAKRGSSGITALWASSFQGRLSCVVKLISAGANLEATDLHGATPLIVASQQGHQLVVQTLLQAGANPVAARLDGVTPLHSAAALCRKGVVELLLENGANPVLKDSREHLPVDLLNSTVCRNGFELYSIEAMLRPIFHAAREGQDWQVKLLIDSGQSVHATLRSNRMTPLHVAAAHGRKEVVQVLLKEGARVDSKDRFGRTPLDVLGTERKLNSEDRQNLTTTLSITQSIPAVVPQTPSAAEEQDYSTAQVEPQERLNSPDDDSDGGPDLILIVMVVIGAMVGISIACAITAFFKFRQTQEAAKLAEKSTPRAQVPTSSRSEPVNRLQSSLSVEEGASTLPPLRSERGSSRPKETVQYYSESSIKTLKKRQQHSNLECASDVNCEDL